MPQEQQSFFASFLDKDEENLPPETEAEIEAILPTAETPTDELIDLQTKRSLGDTLLSKLAKEYEGKIRKEILEPHAAAFDALKDRRFTKADSIALTELIIKSREKTKTYQDSLHSRKDIW